MRILITNDDGIGAPCLPHLAAFAKRLGEVVVVAPKVEQSGKSHAIEIYKKIEIKEVDLGVGVRAYAMDSTPADCVRFALLGHAYEMAEGSDVEITLQIKDIDLIPEALEFARMGILPAGMYRNRRFAEGGVDAGETELAVQDMLYDPQTSGGLLIAVAAEDADALFEELKTTVPSAQRIGTVAEYQGGKRIKLR